MRRYPGVIEGRVIGNEVEDEPDAARRHLPAYLVESVPAAHARIRDILLDAVRRPDHV
jgi:hypothetical protein